MKNPKGEKLTSTDLMSSVSLSLLYRSPSLFPQLSKATFDVDIPKKKKSDFLLNFVVRAFLESNFHCEIVDGRKLLAEACARGCEFDQFVLL